MSPHSASFRRNSRGGFTIIELLIVISLIALLMAISLRVIGAFITAARDSATQTTIRKIQGLLSSRVEALHRLQQSSSFIKNSPEWIIAGQISTDDATRKVLTKKLMQRKYFPQSRAEVLDDDKVSGKIQNPNAHPNITGTATATNPDILYDILANSDTLGEFLTGTDGFSASEVRDTDGNGLPEFVDGWGRPLRFYRWPVRLFRPTGAPTATDTTSSIDLTNAKVLLTTLPFFSSNQAADVARDPDDPLRRCLANLPAGFYSSPYTALTIPSNAFGSAGAITLGSASGPPILHVPVTYHVMLVVSAGPDGVFGMGDPTTTQGFLGDVVDPVALADDISYLSLRAGGK